MRMADIIRQNFVSLISDLRNQDYICTVLIKNRVLTTHDAEEVLCEMTNSKKNFKLLDYVTSRFSRAFRPFCDALADTSQQELYNLLAPARAGINAPVPRKATDAQGRIAATETQERDEHLCAVCLDQVAHVLFTPCGHLSSCSHCSEQLSSCPICRAAIVQRVRVYRS